MKRRLATIEVRAMATDRTRGVLVAGGVAYPCVLGRSGIAAAKREGDGVTPRARLPLRAVFYRAGRVGRPQSLLPQRASRRDDAWCDDPADRRYNRLVRDPSGRAEEQLWRSDRLYDVVVPLGWNDGPVRKGRGSAIFWHVCRPSRRPTAGCVAVEPAVFRKVLPRLSRHCVMIVR